MTEDQLTKLAQEMTADEEDSRETCPSCCGSGLCQVERDTFECPDCDGKGYTEI